MADTVTALEDLYPVGSWACAHRKGDEVPYATPADRQRVKDQGWDDKVAKPAADKVKGA